MMAQKIKQQVDATISFRGTDEIDDQVVIYFRHCKEEPLLKLGMTRDDAATFASTIAVMLGRTSPGSITVEFLSSV